MNNLILQTRAAMRLMNGGLTVFEVRDILVWLRKSDGGLVYADDVADLIVWEKAA